MAKNDIIIIDNIISEKYMSGFPSKGDAFEYFSTEQILKDYDLTKQEVLDGLVDGKDDGGIDLWYIFINGVLYTGSKDFVIPRKGCELTVYIMTCKHHDTFNQDVVNNQYATIAELFDLTRSKEDLKGNYNDRLLSKRDLFLKAYSCTAARLNKLTFEFFYSSRGDASIVGENICARAEQIKKELSVLFSECQVSYSFLGSSEILSLYRQKKEYLIDLKYRGIIHYQNECYIVLCNLKDFYRFITDDGKLRRYLFDSNVRDFLGLNSVNEDIYQSLSEEKEIDFWWLNNGITLLTASAINLGDKLLIKNPQIVNGLQTSQSIYNYYNINQVDVENRNVVLKVITQNDTAIRDKIIRSTNNQTAIESKALFATDKIQRDIEDVLLSHNMFYERRVNAYVNQDIEREVVVDIMYLAAAYVGLVLRVPEKAGNFKQKYLRDQERYGQIFNTTDPLELWPILASLFKKIDEGIVELQHIHRAKLEKVQKRTRYIVAIIIISRLTGTYNYSVRDIIRISELVTDDVIREIVTFVLDRYVKELMIQRKYISEILAEAAVNYSISDLQSFIGRKNIFIQSKDGGGSIKKQVLSEAEIENVRVALPQQPWPSNIVTQVAKQLIMDKDRVSYAIKILIARGVFYRQYGGVVYNKEGEIIAVDETREIRVSSRRRIKESGLSI